MTVGRILAIVFTLGWAALYTIRVESFPEALPEYSWRERLLVLASALTMTLHITLSCLALHFAGETSVLAAVVSGIIFLLGLGFRLWARAQIGPLLKPRLTFDAPLKFQQRGAYGVVRHPLYLGALIAAGAPLAAVPEPHLWATYFLCWAVLMVQSVQEERGLEDQLGVSYTEYCSRVKRLIPFLW